MLFRLNMVVVSDLIFSVNCLNSSSYNNLFFCFPIKRRYFFFCPDTLYLEGDSTVTAFFAPDNPGICKVSVQDDRNVVFWSREYEVEQYRVYREGAVAGDYELVATVPYSDPSVWTDEESRPGERRYSYKMTVVDAQGNESPFSEEHKTMHLTIGQDTGNQWNLAWTEYRGAELESYMIYRGTEENDLQLIGQLPAGGAMSYTDEAAPAGTQKRIHGNLT